MSPGGPVLEPPPAPDSSFPPKIKPREEKPPVVVPTEVPTPPDTGTRKLAQVRDTGTYERAPEPPRRLERTGTQPISEYQDRMVNKSTVPLDKSTVVPGLKETPSGTRPLKRVDTPTATTAVVKTDHLPQAPSPAATPSAPTPPASAPLPQSQPSSPSEVFARNAFIPEQKTPLAERPARPQTRRLDTPAQRNEPATLDSVMPHSEPSRESAGLYAQADFGIRLGAFVLDFMFMLIAVDVIVYLLSASGNRQSLNWWITAIIAISALILLFNLVLLPSFTGQSIGKKLLGIRILHEDGGLLTFIGAIKRHLIGYPLSALPLMYGFLSAMWSPRGRALHDKIAKTVVVKNT